LSTDTAAAPVAKPWLTDFLLVALFWGSSFLFTRITALEFGAVSSAGMRVTVAVITLLAILAARGQLDGLARHWRGTFTVGIFNSGLPFLAFAWALLHISTGLSAIINATVPLFGALVAWAWLKDRPNSTRLLGLAIGFVGVVMLAWGKASFKPAADGSMAYSGLAVLSLLGACLCYGFGACFIKVHLPTAPPLVTATGSQCGAWLLLAGPMVWFWPSAMPSAKAWAAMAASGVLCTALPYILYFRLIDRMGPAKAVTVTYVIPLFAVAAGVVFLNEQVTVWMLLCASIILCGTSLATGLVGAHWRK
jgi:drug/metabolite transporter (DMT)-like permease